MKLERLTCFFLWLLIFDENLATSTFYRDDRSYTSVPEDLCLEGPCSGYTVISLQQNMIKQIRKTDFTSNNFPSLQWLYLSNNVISAIEDGCFKGTQLGVIYLNKNNLSRFPNFTEVKGTLRTVYLANNHIAKINPEMLANLKKIQILDMRWNRLVSFPDYNDFLPELYILAIGPSNGIMRCCIWMKNIGSRLNITKPFSCSWPPSVANPSMG